MNLAILNAEVLACRRCPRLVDWREKVAHEKRRAYREWDYWGKPVPGFGDPHARAFVVGLAPGAHGSNRAFPDRRRQHGTRNPVFQAVIGRS